MNWWEQATGQVLGIGLGQLGQNVDLQQQDYCLRAYGAGMTSSTYSIPIASGSWSPSDTLYIDDKEVEAVKLKVEEPPDEFTQLSNHRFHELLDKFKEVT